MQSGQTSNITPLLSRVRDAMPALLCALVAIALVLWPLGATIVHFVRTSHAVAPQGLATAQPPSDTPTISLALVAKSVAWAGGIAALSAVFAWPAAWLVRRRGWRSVLWIALPAAFPSYLAYHALNLARAPGTMLGDFLSTNVHRWPDAPVLVGQAMAFLGAALWAWPVAAIVLGGALQRLDAGFEDALRIDGAGLVRTQLAAASCVRGTIVRAWAVVALVMLGSAVPLHLAQAPTMAVAAWQEVTLHPQGPQAWIVSWPVLVLACVCAWWLPKETLRPQEPAAPVAVRRTRAAIPTLALVLLGTLVPLALYLFALRSWRSVPAFVRACGDGIVESVWIGVCVGVGAGVLCALAWWSAARGSRAIALLLGCLALWALTPGVLVGQAWLIAAQDLGRTGVVLAHVGRFGLVAALLGVAAAKAEDRATREQRLLDGGGWVRTALVPHAGVVLGAGALCACLSLHEIESSMVLQPAGVESFAQTMLANLHFARQEETSAGCILLIGSSWALALAALAATRLSRFPKKHGAW